MTFKLGNHLWTVEFVKPSDKRLGGHEGVCLSHEHVLLINNTLTAERRFEVIIHEMMHAVESMFDFTIKERYVRMFGIGLAQGLEYVIEAMLKGELDG